MAYRIKNRLFLSKVEAVAGTAETLDPAADAILVEEPRKTPNFEKLQTNEAGGSLDSRASITGGGNYGFSGRIYLRGQGAGGTAPEFNDILRAAALAETITAADITGTAQGGAASSITLAAGESAVDDVYKGMPIEITGDPGSGQTRVIVAYDGTTKVATVTPAWQTQPTAASTYKIPANVLYIPASTSLETNSSALYEIPPEAGGTAILSKIRGAAASGSFTWTTRGLPIFEFQITGILDGFPTDAAIPADGTFDATRPNSFRNADAYLDDLALKFRQATLDLGNTVQQEDDPAALLGFGIAGVVDRPQIQGTINPLIGTVAARDTLQDMVGGVARKLWLRHGGTVGNRVSHLVPAAIVNEVGDADQDGYTIENLTFEADGFDSGHYLCFY